MQSSDPSGLDRLDDIEQNHGSDEGDQTRILKGLQPGDRVVVAGGVLIND